MVLFSCERRIRPTYWVRLPLLATGATRNKVSSAGQSKPSPAYAPVATAKSGGPLKAEGLRVKTNGGTREVSLEVIPIGPAETA